MLLTLASDKNSDVNVLCIYYINVAHIYYETTCCEVTGQQLGLCLHHPGAVLLVFIYLFYILFTTMLVLVLVNIGILCIEI